MSDNSHRWDEEFLGDILREEKIGDVNGGKIVVSSMKGWENIFDKKYVGGSEAFGSGESWRMFIHNSFAPKTPISLLEPYVARLVKAFSACGVKTRGSCDGNHIKTRSVYVETDGEGSVLWSRLICERCLIPRFRMGWNVSYGCVSVRFAEKEKWGTYVNVNRAAEFLYSNRITLREIRRQASDEIGDSRARHLPNQELEQLFSVKAGTLLQAAFG